MKYLLALLLAAFLLPVHASDLPDVERRKIDYLISAIETLEGAEFIRNADDWTLSSCRIVGSPKL